MQNNPTVPIIFISFWKNAVFIFKMLFMLTGNELFIWINTVFYTSILISNTANIN